MKRYFYLLTMVVFTAVIVGCTNPYNHEGEGAGIGGVAGALAGGIIGNQSHSPVAGALIGGALGAAGGAIVGSTMQKPVSEQPAPVVAAQPVSAVVPTATYSGDTVTINVPNSSGGYTAVVLKRSGNGYIGPQGEYYTQIPTTAQLQAMYGR